MTDEAAVWTRFARLLPDHDAQEVQVCWDIGEQEGGLELLVSSLLQHQLTIGETTRVEISVVAETWGVRENITSRLLACPGDGLPSPLELVERPDTVPLTLTDPRLADFLVIPWIRCKTSGRLLTRAHVEEPWGDLSLTPEHYAVLANTQGPSLQLFDSSSAWEALEALRP
ncbi:hypothetical protein [Streptomyces sp. NBC_00091]|uniref:hypothetical protein n=1 Tax=Streptomyces sp. NBC_00091 TaxID=2975648 RepID=UPI00225534F8|nr:hypothetical protein [Streptomyces sp. NBC_00091]MCX5378579.1 hypothetical protein [Streptomyces sp. NBC_00091]